MWSIVGLLGSVQNVMKFGHNLYQCKAESEVYKGEGNMGNKE